jgi:hypothetical protein
LTFLDISQLERQVGDLRTKVENSNNKTVIEKKYKVKNQNEVFT